MHSLREELALLKSESRSLIEQRRVKVRKDLRGRPRGRPIKNSGTYYTRHILISDRLWFFVNKIRMPNEPIGAALERCVGMAQQKRIESPTETEGETFKAPELERDDIWERKWKYLDK